jgi:hypothetical protein
MEEEEKFSTDASVLGWEKFSVMNSLIEAIENSVGIVHNIGTVMFQFTFAVRSNSEHSLTISTVNNRRLFISISLLFYFQLERDKKQEGSNWFPAKRFKESVQLHS